MADANIRKLEAFLAERFGFRIPPGVEFKRMSPRQLGQWARMEDTPESRIVNLTMNDFLGGDFRFNPDVESVVAETIRGQGLKVFAGVVSYDGRREAALATGGNTFSNLKHLEDEGLITRFLSYQGNRDAPSPLCKLALSEGIKVYFVDEARVLGQRLGIHIAQIDEHIAEHDLAQALQIESAKLVPLGQHHEDVGAGRSLTKLNAYALRKRLYFRMQ